MPPNKIVKDKTHLLSLIKQESNSADLNYLDVSNVYDFSYIFEKSKFNGDISKWNVGNALNMLKMFSESEFNGDISNWKFPKVMSTYNMFNDSAFNQDISKWKENHINESIVESMFSQNRFYPDVTSLDDYINAYTKAQEKKTLTLVKDLDELKEIVKTSPYNADLNYLDVSNITSLVGLFFGLKFNGNISNWNVSNVTSMAGMFYKSSFDGDISKWKIQNVSNMTRMFTGSKYSGDLSKWVNIINKDTAQQDIFSEHQIYANISTLEDYIIIREDFNKYMRWLKL